MARSQLSTISSTAGIAAAPVAAPLPQELAEHIGFVLNKARERLHAGIEPIFADCGLCGREFGMLLLLARRGAMRQTDLADALRIDRTTAMHSVDTLQAAALTRRHPYPGDRRANAVKITAAGEKLLAGILPPLAAAERRFLIGLNVAERSQLLNLLSRVVTS